ncbi:MAG: hypothetical protein WBQ55_03250 [Xanthobacteraceae bacterium]
MDELLAWLVSDNIKWVRVQRGAVHVLAFVMFFGATVLAAKAGIVARLLGILMAIIVVGCVVLRMIMRENDPKSLIAVVYIKIFEFLNLFVIRHKLPTWLAVLNLGALREMLRAENLHNTSDIPVTNLAGLRPKPKWDPRYLSEREEDGQFNDLSKPEMGSSSLNPSERVRRFGLYAQQSGRAVRSQRPAERGRSHPQRRHSRSEPTARQ